MFISKKRLKDMERRLSALEKQSKKELSPSEIRSAFKTALDNATCRFEYELKNADKSNPSLPFLIHLQ